MYTAERRASCDELAHALLELLCGLEDTQAEFGTSPNWVLERLTALRASFCETDGGYVASVLLPGLLKQWRRRHQLD